MDGAHKQEDKLNIIAIVAVGICGSVLVYVSIVLLQAYYAADSSAAYQVARYGGQRNFYDTVRAQQELPLVSYGRKHGTATTPDVFQIPVAEAMKLVVADAKVDASNLVPSLGPATTATIRPIYGRPQAIAAAPEAAVAAPASPAAAAPAVTASAPATPTAVAPVAPASGGNAQAR